MYIETIRKERYMPNITPRGGSGWREQDNNSVILEDSRYYGLPLDNFEKYFRVQTRATNFIKLW